MRGVSERLSVDVGVGMGVGIGCGYGWCVFVSNRLGGIDIWCVGGNAVLSTGYFRKRGSITCAAQ